jgi:hypothetical protein
MTPGNSTLITAYAYHCTHVSHFFDLMANKVIPCTAELN